MDQRRSGTNRAARIRRDICQGKTMRADCLAIPSAMARAAVVRLEDGDVRGPAQYVGRGQAGDSGAEDRGGRTVAAHTESLLAA